NSNSKQAKILILDLPHLPTKELDNLVIHCSTIDELLARSAENSAFILIIACTSEKLTELAPILTRISIDTLYILNTGDEIKHFGESWWNKTTIVYNEKQLMRHLCTKSMLCFYNEGLEHRKTGNFGVANVCFLDSIRALNYSAKFI
ncbi:unnamed protein product, partial [Rotaria sp. Silwood2]